MKIITIVDNNPITGVQYGEVEVFENGTPVSRPPLKTAAAQYKTAQRRMKDMTNRNNCKKK